MGITSSTPFPSPSPTLYFGYGSNLWLHQMSLRCPTSAYRGLARLPSYRWIINARGYANVVSSNSTSDVVWGMVYALQPSDEARLDRNEGVPEAYTKEILTIDFWPSDGVKAVDVSAEPERKGMLVYVDRKRVEESVAKEEYVYRMNMGIRDAVALGVPRAYVEGVMRRFIPDGEGRGEVEEKSREQALEFEDET